MISQTSEEGIPDLRAGYFRSSKSTFRPFQHIADYVPMDGDSEFEDEL